MQLFDTHTHLYLPEFDTDRDQMINRAVSSGVVRLLMPNIDAGSVAPMLAAAEKYRGTCFPMIGLHPTSVKDDHNIQIEELFRQAADKKFIAVGEVGIDLYWDKTRLKEQKDALRQQVRFAVDRELPVVIHSRESFPEVFSVLDEFRGSRLRGVFHAFSGDEADAEKALGLGFMLGIGGPVTYKNSRLPAIVKIAGLAGILTETDSPYLSPVPFRGRRNESANIRVIVGKLAEILGLEEEAVALATWNNAGGLFKIS